MKWCHVWQVLNTHNASGEMVERGMGQWLYQTKGREPTGLTRERESDLFGAIDGLSLHTTESEKERERSVFDWDREGERKTIYLHAIIAFTGIQNSIFLIWLKHRLQQVAENGGEKIKWCTRFRRRVKEYVQSTDKLSLIGLTFHAGESYWGIHPYNYHIDDFTPLLPWNISKSSAIDWMEIELVNILFSLLQLSTWCYCS